MTTIERPVLKLGTRGSLLARTQSQLVADLLTPFLPPGRRIELEIITTTGDRELGKPLQDAGGKGLFVKEIEEALLDGRVDFAVHSAKDMPADSPPALAIAATPRREMPNDVWIGHQGQTIAQLPHGAVVGTTSLRRQALLRTLRPDLQTTLFRGNIDTRLRKVREGQVAGTFLAAAGLRRANLLPPDAVILPTDEFIPAAGQGTLALQCRADDALVKSLLANIHDDVTARALAFERRIVQALAGSCLAPLGVYAQPRSADEPGWIVRAFLGTPDGKQIARAALLTSDPSGLDALAPQLLQTLEARGSREILAQIQPH